MSEASFTVARFRSPTQEAPAARLALIAVAVLGVAILIFAPLLAVFTEALARVSARRWPASATATRAPRSA